MKVTLSLTVQVLVQGTECYVFWKENNITQYKYLNYIILQFKLQCNISSTFCFRIFHKDVKQQVIEKSKNH